MRSRRPAKPDTGLSPNLAGRDTALIEALWRGDELAAMLSAVQSALAARERDLGHAQETIAELSEIADAAQDALEELRVQLAKAAEAAQNDRELRDAIAAELFRIAVRRASDRQRDDAGGRENVFIDSRRRSVRNWWRALRRTPPWR